MLLTGIDGELYVNCYALIRDVISYSYRRLETWTYVVGGSISVELMVCVSLAHMVCVNDLVNA